jgi:hypothetical protein
MLERVYRKRRGFDREELTLARRPASSTARARYHPALTRGRQAARGRMLAREARRRCCHQVRVQGRTLHALPSPVPATDTFHPAAAGGRLMRPSLNEGRFAHNVPTDFVAGQASAVGVRARPPEGRSSPGPVTSFVLRGWDGSGVGMPNPVPWRRRRPVQASNRRADACGPLRGEGRDGRGLEDDRYAGGRLADGHKVRRDSRVAAPGGRRA